MASRVSTIREKKGIVSCDSRLNQSIDVAISLSTRTSESAGTESAVG